MPCNHKRVWEVQFWYAYNEPKSELNLWLSEGFEPFPMSEHSVLLKRLKPCEECEKAKDDLPEVASPDISFKFDEKGWMYVHEDYSKYLKK